MSEEKIERLRKSFLEHINEMLKIQDEVKEIKDIAMWSQIIQFISIVMKLDGLLQEICTLGRSGAIIRNISTEEFDSLKNELATVSKELRESLPFKERYPRALYLISEFQLLQRKIISVVANVLGPKPLFEFSKREMAPIYNKNVFIVHGKDEINKLRLANILTKLDFNPIILADRPDKGRTLIEKLEEETLNVGYAFILLTPDDIGTSFNELYEKAVKSSCEDDALRAANRILKVSNGDVQKFIEYCESFVFDPQDIMDFLSILNTRARQNVILELGYFVGKIGRNRVCCLHKGDLELPSDIHGIVYKKYSESIEECYEDIIKELKAVGYDILI